MNATPKSGRVSSPAENWLSEALESLRSCASQFACACRSIRYNADQNSRSKVGGLNMPLRIVLACVMIASSPSLSAAKPRSHPVTVADLRMLIDHADQIVVDVSSNLDFAVVYSSADGKDLSELKTAVSLEPSDGELHCLCMPAARIHLLRKKKELGTVLIYPDALTIGFSDWSSDARILDREKWLQWFDARKIPGPRKAAEEQKERERQARVEEERWMAAMPASLRPVWPVVAEAMFPGQAIDTTALDRELAKEFSDSNRRILALMAWFGSGAGPWSGFPIYESVAEEMLLKYQTAELLVALKDRTLNEAELEGAARLFSGWDFNQRRPQDNRLLPADLKRTLLQHSLKSDDQDKLDRARHAFAPE